MSAADSAAIRDLIYKYFQIAKTKELEGIDDFFVSDGRFSKFGDSPPYERRDSDRAMMLEQLQFASISDFDFKIEGMKIDLLGEDAAAASFILHSSGMVVDDYSFRGSTVNSVSRVTMVLQKDKHGRWRMVHQHFSKLPE